MDSNINYRVNAKENVYFYIRLVFSAGLYFLIVKLIMLSFQSDKIPAASFFVLYFYAFAIILFLFFRFGILMGHLKGNAVRINKNQFPDLYQIVVKQARQLGIKSVPAVYIMQSGGVLNAFAARFLGRNYIILYSEIVEAAYEQDKSILEFIIAHELGHIKRNHMIKNLILIPSYFVPFLGSAYSRACEYTCDNIGHALCPYGVKGGLLILASGTTIYKKVNLNEFIRQEASEDGFWKWFAEKVSSHPNLTKRLAAFTDVQTTTEVPPKSSINEEPVAGQMSFVQREDDHSRYLPQ